MDTVRSLPGRLFLVVRVAGDVSELVDSEILVKVGPETQTVMNDDNIDYNYDDDDHDGNNDNNDDDGVKAKA